MLKLLSRPLRLTIFALSVLQVTGCSSPEQRAQDYAERGTKLLAENDNARASIEFKNALKLNKNLIAAWRGLAETEEAARNWQGLIPILREIVELDPKDVAAKLKLARLLGLGGALDEALTLVNEANDLDARNAEVLALRGLILFRRNDADGAIRDARAALEIDPKNASAMMVLAADRLARGDAKGALQTFDAYTAADGKDLSVELFKLKIFENMQDMPQIEAQLRRLVELYPDQIEFRRQLVRLYLFQRRPEDAEKEERAIAAAHPADVKSEIDLVRLLFASKGPSLAREELVSKINAGGDDVFTYEIALAQLDFTQGNFADAVQLLEKLISRADSPEHVLTAQIELAQMYLISKKIDAAEKLVSEILRKDNRNTAGLRLRASIHVQRRELEPAINDLREALNDQPRSVDLMLLLASAYERSGSMELAEKQFTDALKASNFDVRVGLAYVAFLQRRGGTARAEDIVTQLSGRWPKNTDLLAKLGEIRLARQNWVGAQEVAEAIRRLGDVGMADQLLGAVLAGQNRLEESISVLEKAYAAAPPTLQPIAMFSLVQVYVRAQKIGKAIDFLQSVVKANPNSAEAYILLGSVQLANKAPDQAVKSFQIAIERQPKNMNGYKVLAEYYVREKKDDEALKVVRAGLHEEPDAVVLHLVLAGVLERKGDYDGAISEYDFILDKDPGSLVAANNLASLLTDHRTDKASLARAFAAASMLRKSSVPVFKDTLGWVSYLQGDYKGAISLLEEAVAAMPNNAFVHYHLGMSYIAVGELEKAVVQLKLALNGQADNDLKEKIQVALKKAGT